ncbi:hypothetical protein PG987_005653 [Apiospora arundinis]
MMDRPNDLAIRIPGTEHPPLDPAEHPRVLHALEVQPARPVVQVGAGADPPCHGVPADLCRGLLGVLPRLDQGVAGARTRSGASTCGLEVVPEHDGEEGAVGAPVVVGRERGEGEHGGVEVARGEDVVAG